MNLNEADQAILNGEWAQIVEDLADACLRYRDSGPVRKGSLIYNKWTERAELLKEVTEI